MKRLGRISSAVGLVTVLSASLTGLEHAARAAVASAPKSTITHVWTDVAPSVPGYWKRPSGLFPSLDSMRIYSGLAIQQVPSYPSACKGVPSAPAPVIESIDVTTGKVISTIPTGLAEGQPLLALVADTKTTRLLAFTDTCALKPFTGALSYKVIDVATSSIIGSVAKVTWGIAEVAMGSDPKIYYRLIRTGWASGLQGLSSIAVEAVSVLNEKVLWNIDVGVVDGAQFKGDPVRQYEPHRLAVSSDGTNLYLVQPGISQLLVIKAETGQILSRAPLPAGHDIRDIVVSEITSRAYVTDWTDNSILVLDTGIGQFMNAIKIPGRCPESTSLDAAGETIAVHVACDNPRVLLLSTSDGSLKAEMPSTQDVSEIRLLPNATGMISRRNAELSGARITSALPVSKGPKTIPVPLAPRGVSANAGVGSARVSWSMPVNSSNAKVTGYRVTAKPTGQTCVTKANKTSCSISGLVPGKKYQFSVEAKNAKAWGLKALSPVVEIPRPAPTAVPEPEKPAPELS